MPVTEVFEDLGEFDVTLDPNLGPLDTIMNQVVEHGHIVITNQWIAHPDRFAESVFLAGARYTGPVLEPDWQSDGFHIRGSGNVWHLGDGETGPIHAELLSFTDAVPSTVIDVIGNSGILPTSLTQGTVTDTGVSAFTGSFEAVEFCLDSMRTYMAARNMHFRVNPDWSVDACLATRDDVYTVTAPTAVAVRDGYGTDPTYVGLEPKKLRTSRDASRWVSRSVVERVEYDGTRTYSSFDNRDSNPYFDPQGNALIRNVVQSGPASDALTLDEFHERTLADWNAADQQEIDLDQYQLEGSFRVGDHIYVFDPPSKFVDTANQIWFRGQLYSPKIVQITEDEFDLTRGMGVYYRPGGASVTTADYIDLTRSVKWEA